MQEWVGSKQGYCPADSIAMYQPLLLPSPSGRGSVGSAPGFLESCDLFSLSPLPPSCLEEVPDLGGWWSPGLPSGVGAYGGAGGVPGGCGMRCLLQSLLAIHRGKPNSAGIRNVPRSCTSFLVQLKLRAGLQPLQYFPLLCASASNGGKENGGSQGEGCEPHNGEASGHCWEGCGEGQAQGSLPALVLLGCQSRMSRPVLLCLCGRVRTHSAFWGPSFSSSPQVFLLRTIRVAAASTLLAGLTMNPTKLPEITLTGRLGGSTQGKGETEASG